MHLAIAPTLTDSHSDFGVTQLQETTIAPLQRLIAKRCTSQPNAEWKQYESFTPDLQMYLPNNALTRLPGQLFRLQTLTVLSVRGNRISQLPSAIGNLISLRELNVSNNNLRWLPYEIRGLLRGNLRFCGLYPNPYMRATPKPRHRMRPTSCLCRTIPAFRRTDGSLARGSPPSPVNTLSNWRSPLEPAIDYQPTSDPINSIPSLFETALRSCYNSPQLSQLPFLTPADAPEYLNSALKQTWRLRQEGGQRCTICDTPFIISRTEWIEWWQLAVKKQPEVSATGEEASFLISITLSEDEDVKYHHLLQSPVPLLRRGCSWACIPETGHRHPVRERTGWRPARGFETDHY